MNPTQPTREERCCRACYHRPRPLIGTNIKCDCPCHTTPNGEVEGWEEEFHDKFPFARIIIPSAHGDNIISDLEVKAFISSLIEKVRQERDAFWQEQEMGVSRDCAKHSEEAHEDGIQEGIKIERDRILAALRPCFLYCLEVNGREDCKNCGLHESLITSSHPSV